VSFIEELKRRNVFRVGIAYVVTAWLVLQVADVVLGNIDGVPGWFFTTLLTLIVIGFPVALLLGWAYELTPEGLKRERDIDPREARPVRSRRVLDRVIIGVLAVALAYFAVDKFVLQGAADGGAADSMPAGKSIAVLPFRNFGGSVEDSAFADGMHDELLTQLSRIASLEKVISRTTVEAYRESPKPIPQIGDELGVATILEGSVQRAGDHVRVRVQLIDADNDNHLWADDYDRELTIENLFTIQSEITREVVGALQAVLSDEDESRLDTLPTESLAAWQRVAIGREWLAKRTPEALEEARRYFEEAIEIDPEYALAWVGLADSVALTTDHAAVPKAETFEARQAAIDRALELEPESGEALASLAQLRADEGRFDEAERLFLEAIEKTPNYAPAYLWYSLLFIDLGRDEEGLAYLRKALDLDPGSSIVRNNLFVTLGALGQTEEALRVLREGLQLTPEFPLYYTNMSNLFVAQGNFTDAARWVAAGVDRTPRYPELRVQQCAVLIQLDAAIDGCLAALERDFERLPAARYNDLLVDRDVLRLELDASISRLTEQLQVDPDPGLVLSLAMLHLASGEPEKAWQIGARVVDATEPKAAEKISPEDLQQVVVSGLLLHGSGRVERANAFFDPALDAMSGMPRTGQNGRAIWDVPIYVARGDRARAVAALEDAINSGWRYLWFWLRTPLFDSMTTDPEWNRLIAQLEADIARQRSAYLDKPDVPLF
jgi:TolB-like protein/thioredoxin-like negative regulator of GroEL